MSRGESGSRREGGPTPRPDSSAPPRQMGRDEVERLYAQARALHPEARIGLLEDACRQDPQLQHELLSLLEHAAQAEAFFGHLTDRVLPAPYPMMEESDLPAGHATGHYLILGRIGAGGMGTVYRARDTRLDRDVALKFLPAHLSASRDAEERLLVEAKAAAALEHINICTVHEIGATAAGRPFIAMALYEGETLKERLGRGPLAPAEAVQVAAQIARGLMAAHAHGIVHRDVKPGNVMITGDGTVKLLDFGLAKMTDVTLTRPGMTPGTVAYMSPEQARGDPVDPTTDLWSLGIVLYEMLAGVRPFRGGNDHVVIRAILHEEPDALGELSPDTPESLVRIVDRLLHKEPDARYGGGEMLLADLQQVFPSGAGAPSAARPSVLSIRRERRVAFLTLAALALAALVLVALAAPRLADRREASVPAVAVSPFETDLVLVADFADFTSDSFVADVVSEALRMDLARSPVLAVPGAATVAGALRRMRRDPATRLDSEVAREVAVREGIGALIEGEVLEAGAGYVISAAMVGATTGKIVNGWRVTAGDSTGIIDAIDRLSTAIRRDLGESLASIETGEPLFHATTASLEALRSYSAAGRAYHRGDFLHAAALLEEAIRLDSAFARAHYLLATSLRNAGVRRGRALDAVAAAYRLRDRLPAQERHAVTAEYYMSVVGDLPKAIQAFRNQVEAARGTGELALYAALGWSLALTGDLAGAEAVLREARDVYSTAVNQSTLVQVLYRRGKRREAADVLQEAMRLYPDHPLLHARRVEMAAASGDLAAADSLANELPPGGGVGVAHRLQALSAAVRGRIRDAIGHLRAQRRQQVSAGHVAEAAAVSVAIARLHSVRGERQEALAEVEGFLSHHPLEALGALDRPYLLLARFFADGGWSGRARQLLAAYEREVPRELRGPDRRSYLRARAAIHLADGDPWAARADLERANREPPIGYLPFDDPFLSVDEGPEMARAYDRSGEPDSAISTYERYLAARSLGRTVVDAFELPGAIVRLAELYEARGDQAAAARHYLWFAELWTDADAELQPRVEAARKRAAPGG